MAKALVEVVENLETDELEYDVAVFGSDDENTGSISFYCGSKNDAEELSEKFNVFLKENKHLFQN